MNSQASVRKLPSVPACTLPPMRSSSPPMWMVGSRPASSRAVASMEVSVVLPCVPLTAMEGSCLSANSPSSSARSICGMFHSPHATRSTLSGAMAAV